MIIWTCKGALAALALTTLAACAAGQGPSFLDGLSALGTPREAKPFSQVTMAQGAVTLKAPRGFCIDPRSLKQRFALMARCDTLGAPGAAQDAPLGLITVSVAPANNGTDVPTPQDTAAALGLTQVANANATGRGLTFRANGSAPLEGVAETHWRGTTLIGGYVMSVALFGPKGGRAASTEGRGIVEQLMARSDEGT